MRDFNIMLKQALASRRAFLRGAAATAVAGGAGVLSARSARAATATRSFTPAKGGLFKEYILQIQGHENAHRDFLISALGSAARPVPTFQNLEMPTFAKFAAMSHVLENLEVGAYLNAAPVIDSPANLAAAGSIMTIEARHAGYLNSAFHDPITGQATDFTANPSVDTPFTPAEVDAIADPFIASLNGGPPVTYDEVTPSPENDIAILNFALASEYLGSTFYNLNVTKFYGKGS